MVVGPAALRQGRLRVRLSQAERPGQGRRRGCSRSTGAWTSCSAAGRSPPSCWATSPRTCEPLRTAIRQADARAPGNDVIGQMVTVDDVLPGTTEEQQRKLKLLDQIRKSTNDPALDACWRGGRGKAASSWTSCARRPRCGCCIPPTCPRWRAGRSPRPTAPWAGCCWSTRPSRACRSGTARAAADRVRVAADAAARRARGAKALAAP